jgi:hypothetical protein
VRGRNDRLHGGLGLRWDREREVRLRRPSHVADAERCQNPIAKTINSELSVLRQVLKHAKLWARFQDEYKALKNTKPPVGPSSD